MMPFKKEWLLLAGIAAGIGLVAFGITRVSATHVTINGNLSVTPNIISFATVFPGEILYKPIVVGLSNGFIADPSLDDVEYRILQRPKPLNESDREYCAANPADYTRCYRSLCPYLSKTADNAPANDTSIPAFHDPNASSSIALGRLAKSESDTLDNWVIDLHTPCFAGQCDQANSVPAIYQLDASLNGTVFGCDLVVEVLNISYSTTSTSTLTSTHQFTLKQKSYPGVADDQYVGVHEFRPAPGGDINLATDTVTIVFRDVKGGNAVSRFKIIAGPGKWVASSGGRIFTFTGAVLDEVTGDPANAVIRIYRPARASDPFKIALDFKSGDFTDLEGQTHKLIRTSFFIGDDAFGAEGCFARTSDGDLYWPKSGITCP